MPATAQTKLDKGQLDQLLAPVALYPDSLLSQVLMGAIYPDDIAAATQWSAAHAGQSGDAARRNPLAPKFFFSIVAGVAARAL